MSFDIDKEELMLEVKHGKWEWLWSAYQVIQKERDEACNQLKILKEALREIEEETRGKSAMRERAAKARAECDEALNRELT